MSAGFGGVVFRQPFNPPAERMSMVESKVLGEKAPWYFQNSGLWNREVYVYLENANQFTSATKLQACISYYILTTFFSGFVQSVGGFMVTLLGGHLPFEITTFTAKSH